MKNSISIVTGIFVLLLSFPACDFDDDANPFRDCEDGSGGEVEQTLNMPEFTGINVDVSADVYITQGGEFQVIAKGEENIIDLLELDVQNDIWEIEFEDCVENYDLELHITLPEITTLKISGSGTIFGENFFTVENIILRINGSGEMDLGLNAEKIDAKISGSGEISLEGTAEDLEMKISGSGDLKAFPLVLESCYVNISGSGNASVNVMDFLEVKISGSGSVFYKGNPTIDIEISGSGDLIDAN